VGCVIFLVAWLNYDCVCVCWFGGVLFFGFFGLFLWVVWG
jgi:hypothetical protein